MWLYPHLGPGAPWARKWLMTCVLQWKSFKCKQNGVQTVWLQTCSAQCEVNEMWQTLLFQLRPCDLFTIRSLLDRVSALSCHHCEWTDTRWWAVTECTVVPLGEGGHALSACKALQRCHSGVRTVYTTGMILIRYLQTVYSIGFF